MAKELWVMERGAHDEIEEDTSHSKPSGRWEEVSIQFQIQYESLKGLKSGLGDPVYTSQSLCWLVCGEYVEKRQEREQED